MLAISLDCLFLSLVRIRTQITDHGYPRWRLIFFTVKTRVSLKHLLPCPSFPLTLQWTGVLAIVILFHYPFFLREKDNSDETIALLPYVCHWGRGLNYPKTERKLKKAEESSRVKHKNDPKSTPICDLARISTLLALNALDTPKK